ncbi:glycoside hydrolase family 43 protein [Flagellimonas halotolerans]|uniref:Glycoside hydrolase family 43 protein n=1 Tax=Flagellimonas halotolerans TaxID=3112164 RepID=A0ABU6IUE8_9FLAO|nr:MULTISPECIES: glycoside hydrolase family 43 protein [unclassified Allomuricauda]MEC3966926.1 glycoside hydrolase family 43 protein [Muricauda sp. SYSU M86414]MEC4266755.1 glycoside hydrolase family 43 protein [Muricauda sp. SYSU M84420]
MNTKNVVFSTIFSLFGACSFAQESNKVQNNPIFEGWYADPEGIVFEDTYWVYPTFSDDYDKQLHFDAFSSKDLVHWEKHERILDTTKIKWLRQALWAPSIIEKDSKYYLFFGANDIQRPGRSSYDPNNDINHYGGIGVAVADSPSGPFEDHLGKPLISDFYNNAQPIDQFVFKDVDGTHYFFYGGWSHCNLGILNEDFTGFEPWEDGSLFKEITPEGYVEGPFMFLRNGIYYFMWSEGNWTDGSYKVAYAMADKPTGPYKRIGTILESKEGDIATGAGHHSVINKPGTDEWIIVYHRRPIPNKDRDHRVTCMDKMEFNPDGTIKPVTMTFEGVGGN